MDSTEREIILPPPPSFRISVLVAVIPFWVRARDFVFRVVAQLAAFLTAEGPEAPEVPGARFSELDSMLDTAPPESRAFPSFASDPYAQESPVPESTVRPTVRTYRSPAPTVRIARAR